MTCTKGFQSTGKTGSRVDVSPAGSVNLQRKTSAITGLKKDQCNHRTKEITRLKKDQCNHRPKERTV